MCILFVHINPDPEKGQYRLVLASNKDESYKRPSKPTSRIEGTNVIGGMDMEPGKQGGMQLGFSTKYSQNGETKKHCVSTISSLGNKSIEHPLGRGWLVRNYLESEKEFLEYIAELKIDLYNGFSFVGIELSESGVELYLLANNPHTFCKLSGLQTIGLSNSHPLRPLRKVTVGREQFETILEKKLQEDNMVEELFKLLKDKTKHLPDAYLEKTWPTSYEQMSSICWSLTKFGGITKSHTVILIDYDWNMKFIEHAMETPIDPEHPKWVVTEIKENLHFN